jgi:hypothetical protein
MNRRSFVSTISSLVLASSLALAPVASADMVYEPPPRLEVQATTTTYTTPPRSIALTVTNPSDQALEVQGPRLVVLTGGVRVPVRVTRLEIDGAQRGLWDAITLPAHGTVRMTLGFDELPATALAAGRIDFSLRLQGASDATFSLRRA